jgi:glycerophosphoryl diester phosphodiesterase
MVIHDDTLQRTTGQPGEVHRMPAGKLARTRASVGFEGTEFANETIPELGPLLIVAAHAGLCVNVELKPGPEGPEALAAAVMRTVTAIEWALPLRRLLLSSFDAQALAAIRAARPESGRALLVEHSDSQSIATALELGCISVNVGEAACTTETMVAASQAGLHTCVWTVNRLETASILFRQGAAAVFTDQLAFLNQPGVESL